ncbi:hypothetical protein [Trichlorobacter lovleyi]|uniref:hypothetical protein n=1 Tax=Trichlorobacter lovleyi TaxID=313985 RepID=UPI0023EF6C95|nr:hypothetical protein [Trichlorobacter lovleyi]
MRIATALALAAVMALPSLGSAESNFNVNVNLGVPVPPSPTVVVAPRVVFDAPPLFLAPSSLGFYVGVDMSYDMVLISGVYYLFQGNHWYRANHYNGPWVVTRYEQLPAPVRKYKVEKIRYYRDHEYRAYHANRDHYRGKHFRPDREDREEWRDEKNRRKEDKREAREEWKEHKKHGRGHGRDND